MYQKKYNNDNTGDVITDVNVANTVCDLMAAGKKCNTFDQDLTYYTSNMEYAIWKKLFSIRLT